jgi:hypothetical protein
MAMPSDAAKVSGQVTERPVKPNGVVLHVMRAVDNTGVKSIGLAINIARS